jgi:type III restriction enzyme
MLQLRDYQQRSLNALEAYLNLTGQHGAQRAFVLQTNRPYTAVTQLPELPYICLRVPTGGGKTFMACHAVGIAAKAFLQADRATCLWLVPSNTIREQTLRALRNREHPYREALDARFDGQIHVMDLKEALDAKRSVLQGATAIIVSTLAALRVEDPDGRKVYDTSGSLMDHFSALSAELEAVLERREDGTIPYSLANVLRMWRPLVIMDEAHNARTPLSFDTLQRFNPSCILEFTATPDALQNVLHHVSAAELKAEDMVKLPIKLWTHGDWKEVIAQAREMQQSLERAAQEEQRETGDYIRPIVLLQAQPKSKERQTLTVDVLKQSLISDFKIPEDQIAVATGETRGIDEIDLFDQNCRLRFIITVQALKEGWDCSFAYVLCSVAETSSLRAVEQILGRVLRLPGARRKRRPELNCAYAYVASPRFIEAATTLKDALVENGFQKLEAADFVVPREETGQLFAEGTLFPQASECVMQKPDLFPLPAPLRAQVSYSEHTSVLTVTGALSHPDMEALQACFIGPEDRAAVERIYEKLQGHRVGPPASRAERPPFRVPWLGIQVDGQLEILDESYFKDVELRLGDWDARLSETEFPSEIPSGESGEVDIGATGKVEVRRFADQLRQQLALVMGESGWTLAALVDWLDRQRAHIDIPQAQSAGYIARMISMLTQTRGLSIEQLARQKFRLANAIWMKIDQLRKTEAGKGYNALLFGPGAGEVEVNPEFCFEFDPDRYAPNKYYEGGYQFQKHYFHRVGELDGEEFECAQFIDSLVPQVWHWVRNLVRSESSFWLPTSTDRFYPDFVVLLNDGRVLLVEYKNEKDWSNDDSKEKRQVGDLWVERSGGRCLFVMPKGKDWQAIMATISTPSTQANGREKLPF